MLFRWTLIVLVLLCAAGSLAAGPLPENTPSGILVDRVLPMAHLEDLEGTLDGPVVDLPRWRQAVHELSRAAEYPLGWPTARDLGAARLVGLSSHEIPLAVLWSLYDRLDAEGQVQPAQVFAFTPLRQEVFHGQSIVFSLSPESILTHKAEDLISWALDADDGQGWQEFRPGQDIPVSYSTTGAKHLRMMVELNDGRLVFGNALLQVKRLVTPEPTETWPIIASESFDGASATGLAYLYLAEEHATLTNPVVVVEGFDLDNSMDWPVLYDLLNQENLLEDLRAQGFDAVVLDFTEATEPIQRNAFVFTQLLSQVQAAAGVGSSTAVVGASMGGLVSRYGLAWLENEGVDHNVRTFISFDSPQTGANIPLGLQYWVNFFREQAAEAEYLLSRLNTPAALQMLLYHYVDDPLGVPGPDPLLPAFQADLLAVGNWPAQPRLVAVANGSGLGVGQGFTAGDQLIHYEYRNTLVDIDGHVWSVPESTPQVIFDGMINPIWPLPDSYQTVTVGETLPWDNAPGGNRGTMAQMGETEVPYGDIVALHDDHCFIPTVSALALEVTDPFFDIDGAPDLMALTPFDAVYFPAANEGHIAVTPENKVWLLTEINSGMTPVLDQVPSVGEGPVLYPAAPNPFNPSTRISFRLDQPARVTLQIHDLAGRLVRTLVSDEVQDSGLHTVTWSGLGDGGQSMASGVYLCRLQVGSSFRSQRLTLLK